MKTKKTVILVVIAAVIVIAALGIRSAADRNREDAGTAVNAPGTGGTVIIDGGDPGRKPSSEDLENYNIPEDAIILDEGAKTVDPSSSGYNIPEGSIILDEDKAPSVPAAPQQDGASGYNIPAGSVIIDEDDAPSAPAASGQNGNSGYNIPDDAVIIDDDSSSSGSTKKSGYSGYNIPDNAVIIDEDSLPPAPKKNSGGYNIPEGSVIIDGGSSSGKSSGSGSGSYGTIINSGSYSSSTGTALNISANYTASTLDANNVQIIVSVSIQSGSLQAKSQTVSVTVGGVSRSLTVPAINYNGGGTISTSAGTAAFTLPLAEGQSGRFTLSADYYFGGTYSGTYIGNLSCGGTFNLSR